MPKKASSSFFSRGLLIKATLVFLVLLLVGLAWLDALVRSRFDSHQWQLPARVYARPVELYNGRVLDMAHIDRLVALMRYREEAGARTPGSWAREGDSLLLHTRGFRDSDGGEQARRIRLRISGGRVAGLANADGGAVSVARLEPMQIGSIHPGHSQDRILVRLEQTPPTLVDMLLAVEDRQFYEHRGVSFRGLARATVANLRAGGVRQGGSTLTQQLVKNFWLSRDRTLSRKLLELPMAVLLELHYEKPQILETYLNEVYLGQDGARAIHGMGLAAQFYFGRPLEELDTHHLALLVGMLRGPGLYDPRRRPERAQARRDLVLRASHAEGVISAAQLERALARPLEVVPREGGALYAFPAFIDLVRRQLARDYAPAVLSSEGLIIHSTLDVLAQLAAEDALAKALEARDPGSSNGLTGAVVMTAPDQGDVLAVVGDRRARSTGFNRALDAVRPIGSLAKPAVVQTALEQPRRYHLARHVMDEPFEVPLAHGQVWAPKNFDNESRGPIPMLDALAHSRNQGMASLGMEVGLDKVIVTLRRLGVQRRIPAYPSILLGSLELSPFEVAVMYQPLATGGFRTPLRSITDVLDLSGTPLARYPVSADPVLDQDAAFLTQWSMIQVMREGTGRGLLGVLPADITVAGKTGTSDGFRDAWFAGFSGNHLAVVWVGRDDNQPAGVTGSNAALPIWGQVMASVPQRTLRESPPPGVEWVWMDADGERTSAEGCGDARRYPMMKASIPSDSTNCGARRSDNGGGIRGWFRRLRD
ncbi:MAG: penicillin-binding protein 1B [Alcanivorax sp.]|nr:penicillin-binding protein 1B [Alcanivorax sp.]